MRVNATSSSAAIKSFCGLQYFTGAHPEVRAQFRRGGRPQEFGNKVWATSLRLIEYFEQSPRFSKGLRVLEIGCGWGLVGLYLAKIHGCKVTCSDIDPSVLPIVHLHSRLNQVEVDRVEAGFADMNSNFLSHYDLIVGAEVCYSQDVAKALLEMMERGFQAGVEKIVIADPGRPDFEEELPQCRQFCEMEILELPGSINGKTTQLLKAKSLHS